MCVRDEHMEILTVHMGYMKASCMMRPAEKSTSTSRSQTLSDIIKTIEKRDRAE